MHRRRYLSFDVRCWTFLSTYQLSIHNFPHSTFNIPHPTTHGARSATSALLNLMLQKFHFAVAILADFDPRHPVAVVALGIVLSVVAAA